MILRDFNCIVHGVFESGEEAPKCPFGCSNSFVEKVFLQPPMVGNGTKMVDNVVKDLANDFGLTNLDNRGGDSVKNNAGRVRERTVSDQILDRMGGAWQSLDGSRNALQALSGLGVQGQNALSEVKPMLNSPKPQVVARHDGKIE